MSKTSLGGKNKKNTVSSVSLDTWGKYIYKEYIDPIEDIIEKHREYEPQEDEQQEDGISDISESSNDSYTKNYFLKMRKMCLKRLNEILKRPCFRVSIKIEDL